MCDEDLHWKEGDVMDEVLELRKTNAMLLDALRDLTTTNPLPFGNEEDADWAWQEALCKAKRAIAAVEGVET